MINILFCLIAVLSNIISAKMIELPYISIPAGLLTYPITFLLSNLVNEIYGPQMAKRMVYQAFALNLLTLGVIQLIPGFELSALRIFSSLAASIAAQIAEIQIYAFIRRRTGPRLLWLRNNSSTCASQLIDTVIVDLLYFYWGLGMGWNEVMPIILFSYLYKSFFSFLNTPFFYLILNYRIRYGK